MPEDIIDGQKNLGDWIEKRKKKIDQNGFGRRKSDGTCLLHDGHSNCIAVTKEDIKTLEVLQQNLEHRLAAIEPTIKHNTEEIDSMRKLQLATLVSALISTVGVITGLVIMIAGRIL